MKSFYIFFVAKRAKLGAYAKLCSVGAICQHFHMTISNLRLTTTLSFMLFSVILFEHCLESQAHENIFSSSEEIDLNETIIVIHVLSTFFHKLSIILLLKIANNGGSN